MCRELCSREGNWGGGRDPLQRENKKSKEKKQIPTMLSIKDQE